MQIKKTVIFIALFAFGTFACQNSEPKNSEAPLTLQVQKIVEKANINNSSLSFTAEIPTLPNSDTVHETLAEAINKMVIQHYIRLTEVEDEKPKSMEELFPAYRKIWEATNKELKVNKSWLAESTATIEQVNPRILNIRLTGKAIAAGSQAFNYSTLASFDTRTGKVINPLDYLTDKLSLFFLCSKKALEVEKTGVNTEKFEMPKMAILTKDGVIFYYNPYEIGGQSIGDTEFEIKDTELQKMLDIQKLRKELED